MSRIWTTITLILLLSLFIWFIIRRCTPILSKRILLFVTFLTLGIVIWLTLISRQPLSEAIIHLKPHFHQQLFRIKFNSDGSFSRIQFGPLYEETKLNILLFVPLGLLFPIVFDKLNSFWKVLFCGIILSIVIEATQYVSHLGWFDIDDILMNIIGVCIGYIDFKLMIRKNDEQ